MKKIGDKIYLTEEEASPGFLCPEGAIIKDMPLCNVCQNWDGPGKLGVGEEGLTGGCSGYKEIQLSKVLRAVPRGHKEAAGEAETGVKAC